MAKAINMIKMLQLRTFITAYESIAIGTLFSYTISYINASVFIYVIPELNNRLRCRCTDGFYSFAKLNVTYAIHE